MSVGWDIGVLGHWDVRAFCDTRRLMFVRDKDLVYDCVLVGWFEIVGNADSFIAVLKTASPS